MTAPLRWQPSTYPTGRRSTSSSVSPSYIETATNDKARHAALVENIQSIRRATIRELWTDPDDLFPDDQAESRWWEVWLRNRDNHERERFTAFAAQRRLRTSQHYLGFGDRTVVLLRATADELSQTFESLDDIAELRRPHNVASLLAELPASEQTPWAEDRLNRLQAADGSAPVVCVLDTGVQDSHPAVGRIA
jgi:hypothetical protein